MVLNASIKAIWNTKGFYLFRNREKLQEKNALSLRRGNNGKNF